MYGKFCVFMELQTNKEEVKCTVLEKKNKKLLPADPRMSSK